MTAFHLSQGSMLVWQGYSVMLSSTQGSLIKNFRKRHLDFGWADSDWAMLM
jgi:hypothetical protein